MSAKPTANRANVGHAQLSTVRAFSSGERSKARSAVASRPVSPLNRSIRYPPQGLLIGLAVAAMAAACGASSARSATTSPSRTYKVPSGSMEPTLPIGTRVTISPGRPALGAIVVYHPPEGAASYQCGPKRHVVQPGGAACDAPFPKASTLEFIKRIVAGPGDELYIREGHVYRRPHGTSRFVREKDTYIRACHPNPEAGCDFPRPIRIPAGHWFLMGDNRANPTTAASQVRYLPRGFSASSPRFNGRPSSRQAVHYRARRVADRTPGLSLDCGRRWIFPAAASSCRSSYCVPRFSSRSFSRANPSCSQRSC